MAQPAAATDDEATDEEIVLLGGRNSTSDLIYHLPDPDDPTETRCHISRQVDRPWRTRPRSTIVYRRACKSCEAAAESGPR